MCPQITKIDIKNAIKNMNSHTIFVYKDDDKKIHFCIQICCGDSGIPHITYNYRLNNLNTCFSDEPYKAIESFNTNVKLYYEKNQFS